MKFSLLIVLLAGVAQVRAQRPGLTDSVNRITADARGKVGVYIGEATPNKSLSVYGRDHFPMLSVFKFPLALYILDQVDKKQLSPDQLIQVHKKEWPKLYSPMLNRHQEENFTLSLRELLEATVSQSDNVGCDILFRLAGGPSVVNTYMHGLWIGEINIVATEGQMAADPQNQYRNWCTPTAMALLLEFFDKGKILSPSGTELLKQLMTATTTGPKRIRGLLPPLTVVTHKTGTSDTDA